MRTARRSPLARRVRAAAVAGTLAASLALTGCSGDEDGGKKDGTSLEGDPVSTEDFVDVYGAALENATTARFTMTAEGGAGTSAEGVMDFSTEPPATELTLTDDNSGQSQELVMIDQTLFVKTPKGGYLSTPLGESGLSSGGLDPAGLLDAFGDAVIEASDLGLDEIDGETFEHYRVLLDGPKITNSEDIASDEASPEVPSTITLDVYLGDGLLRQVSLDLGEESGKVTVKYFDWGKPGAVKAPSKDQIEKSPGAKN